MKWKSLDKNVLIMTVGEKTMSLKNEPIGNETGGSALKNILGNLFHVFFIEMVEELRRILY